MCGEKLKGLKIVYTEENVKQLEEELFLFASISLNSRTDFSLKIRYCSDDNQAQIEFLCFSSLTKDLDRNARC